MTDPEPKGKKSHSAFEESTGSAITEVDQADLSAYDDEYRDVTGIADFSGDNRPDPTKFRVSTLKLAQGMSKVVTDGDGKPGQWSLPNYPAYKEITFVPFDTQSIRRLLPDPKQPPKCQSKDGIFGIGVPGGRCVDCPMAKWGERDRETGKSQPPACKEGVVVRGYVHEFRTMVDLPLMTSSSRVGNDMAQRALSDGWCSFIVKLGSQTKGNNLGTWFIPKPEYETAPDPEILEAAFQWYQVHAAMKNHRRAQLGLPPVEAERPAVLALPEPLTPALHSGS